MRAIELNEEPLCVECLKHNIVKPGRVRDHIKPHKGDPGLFHDPRNRQTLCDDCHNRKTAIEDGGFGRGGVLIISMGTSVDRCRPFFFTASK